MGPCVRPGRTSPGRLRPGIRAQPCRAPRHLEWVEITLKGTAHDPDGDATLDTYEWDFGDGSPVVTGTVTDPYAIEARHTYVGNIGDICSSPRLTVTDTSGKPAATNTWSRSRTAPTWKSRSTSPSTKGCGAYTRTWCAAPSATGPPPAIGPTMELGCCHRGKHRSVRDPGQPAGR